MIEVDCFTNMDLLNESWPGALPCRPVVGDIICSDTVHYTSDLYQERPSPVAFRLELEVIAVRFVPDNKGVYKIEVELADRKLFKRSISEFYKWYAPKVGKTSGYFI